MRKLVIVGLLGAMLAACGDDNGSSSSSAEASQGSSLSSVSSASSISSSSVANPVSSSSVANPVSSSSLSSTSSSASESAFSGDADRGRIVFNNNCSTCHRDTTGDGFFDDGEEIDPDALGASTRFSSYDPNTLEGLAAFIENEMGLFTTCDTQCAEDTAAYIWSLKDGVPGPGAEAVACANPGEIHYGRRVLHILTSYEYHNSLSQLFGAPLPEDYSSPAKFGLDVEVARLPNHSSETLNETRLNTYYDNAREIADWAMSTSGALPFACDDPIQCSNDFITEFAYVAYRRALTDIEQAEITTIFTDAPDLEEGLRWALRTVLMSPNFLYRSELGTPVADLLANPVVAPGTQYDFRGTPTTIGLAQLNGYTPHHINYQWTGNDLIEITLSGVQQNDQWSILTVGSGYNVGSNVVERVTINHSGDRTYYFLIDFIPTEPLYVANDVNAVPGVSSMDPMPVSLLRVGALGEAEPVQDDVARLMAADQTAYALDPYEYASALSFALTGSGPSKSFLDAAVAGELVDRASLEAHVDAMIDSDLGRAHVARLAGKWFRTDGLDSVTRNDDEFTREVRESMMQEIREIFSHVFYNGDFPSIYTGDFTFLDSTLSEFYGIPGGGSSHGDFRYVDTTGLRRGGVIASGAYMAYNAHMDYSSPIQRSARFRQDVLCQAIPLPVNLEDSAEREAAEQLVRSRVEAGDITTADYFDIQTNTPGTSCASCHNAIINPLFGMDDFDHVGRLRPIVDGNVVQDGLVFVNGVAVPQGDRDIPIDQVNQGSYLYAYNAVGTLSGARADAAKEAGDGLFFTGAKDLGRVIVENNLPGVDACLIEKTTRYALGYTLRRAFLEPSENGHFGISSEQETQFACMQDELMAAYAGSGSPRDVLKAIVMSDAFRFRK